MEMHNGTLREAGTSRIHTLGSGASQPLQALLKVMTRENFLFQQ
jgi:hypothetical protein